MINPAYAGIYTNFSANLISRKQWTGINGAPFTSALTVTSSFTDRFGSGLLVVTDQFGINQNLETQLAFSYKVINEPGRVLSLGVQGGVVNYRYDYSKLNIEYIDDTDLPVGKDRYTKPNFGGGAFYMTDLFYVGISVPRILSVNVNDGVSSSTRYQRHFYVSGGYVFNGNARSDLLRVKTSFLLRLTERATSLDLSGTVLFLKTLWTGITLRNFSAIALTNQFQINNSLRLGYSFELPSNSLIRSTYGTHELSLLLELSPMKGQHKAFRYF